MLTLLLYTFPKRFRKSLIFVIYSHHLALLHVNLHILMFSFVYTGFFESSWIVRLFSMEVRILLWYVVSLIAIIWSAVTAYNLTISS